MVDTDCRPCSSAATLGGSAVRRRSGSGQPTSITQPAEGHRHRRDVEGRRRGARLERDRERVLEGAVTAIVVAKGTRTKATVKRGAKRDPAAAARALRREIASMLRADMPDLAALEERFESLRDLTDRPERLFAIALDEAAALTAAFDRTRDTTFYRAALESHRRLLEGHPEGARRAGLESSCRSIERLVRLRLDAKLGVLDRARVLLALSRGYASIGDFARALTILERVLRDADELPTRGGTRFSVRLACARRGFEFALEAADHREALRWGARGADLLARDRESHRSGAYADALAPLAALSLEVGQVERAYDYADAWIAAERIATDAGAARGSRLAEALAMASHAASVIAARDDATAADRLRAVETAARHTDESMTAASAAATENTFEFARARALDALAHEVDVVTHLAPADESRLQSLVEYARALGEPGLEARVHVAHLARLVADGDWIRIAPIAEAALSANVPASGVLAVAIRSCFARGDDDRVRAHGDAYFATIDAATDAAECAAVLSLVAAAEMRRYHDERSETERERFAREWLVRVHQITARVLKVGRLARDSALASSLLAARAAAEECAGLESLARRDARNAVVRIRSATSLPIETAAFVAWVHEIVTPEDALRRIDLAKLDSVALSARALGAAQRGDGRRAMLLCAALDSDALSGHPEALAHALVALTITLRRSDPSDRLGREGAAASEELSAFATLPIECPRSDRRHEYSFGQNGVDALDAGE
jgi:hypothetical protein